MPDGSEKLTGKARYSAGFLNIKKWVTGNLTMNQKTLI